MTTEQELKDQCTPEFIKWMCELAEGFKFEDIGRDKPYIHINNVFSSGWYYDKFLDNIIFPLLIHRAVEGWNNKNSNDDTFIFIGDNYLYHALCYPYKCNEYKFKDYQPQSLTQAECVMLNCMLDIFKEERK